MLFNGTMQDLRNAAKNARALMRAEKLRHVVYAYKSKEHPADIMVLDWEPLKFKTDAEFEAYIKISEPHTVMMYAVHAI